MFGFMFQVSFGQTLLSGMLKSTEMDEMVFTPEDRGALCGDPAASLGGGRAGSQVGRGVIW